MVSRLGWIYGGRAERRHGLAQLRVAHARHDRRAGRNRELDPRDADAAGGAVDEQVLARSEPALGEEGVVRGRERLREPAGFEWPEGVRHRHGRPLVHDRQLGLPPTADHGHDPVTHAEAQDAGPDRGHDAGKLEARDVRRGARRSRVPTGSLQQVRSIQAGGLDFDEKFARPWNRVGLLFHDD